MSQMRESKHVESSCNILSIKAKCVMCENSHYAQSDLCSHRKKEMKRMKKTRTTINVFSYFFIKARKRLVASLIQQIFEITSLFSSVAREENQKLRFAQYLLIHLYGDDTVQVSILYECSLLIE
jgi:hypothetical protein